MEPTVAGDNIDSPAKVEETLQVVVDPGASVSVQVEIDTGFGVLLDLVTSTHISSPLQAPAGMETKVGKDTGATDLNTERDMSDVIAVSHFISSTSFFLNIKRQIF